MSLNGFEKVCRFSDLKEKDGKRFWVDDIDVAVIKVGNKVYAFSNVCPHQHSPVMYSGFVEEGCIVCPNHGWMFELEPGTVKNANSGLDRYEVKIENGDVFVKATKKKDFSW